MQQQLKRRRKFFWFGLSVSLLMIVNLTGCVVLWPAPRDKDHYDDQYHRDHHDGIDHRPDHR